MVTAAAALPANFANGRTVSIAGTSNAALNANWTIASLNTAAKTFQINAPNNSAASTGGTATVTFGIIASTTAQATLAGHGYVSGQSVTITGATPLEYNGTFNITVPTVSGSPDPDHFIYTMSATPSTSGNAVGTITASGNTTIATATHASATAFLSGTTVNISGASIAAYNGAKTVLASPAPTTTSFSYSVGATAIGPNTASPVYAVQGGSTTVTVTTTTDHGFLDGDSVVISGSDVGYNGTWKIACPSGCIPLPPLPGLPPVAPRVFTFNTATDNVAPTAAITTPLPANTSTSVTASLAAATISTVTATVINHGFDTTTNNLVVIESTSTPADANHPGTWTVTSVVDANTFRYSTGTAKPAPAGTFTARPPVASSRAIVTVAAHGYAAAQTVDINGAAPAAYNSTKTVSRVVDANTFEYAMTTAPGPNTSGAVTASVKTTTRSEERRVGKECRL